MVVAGAVATIVKSHFVLDSRFEGVFGAGLPARLFAYTLVSSNPPLQNSGVRIQESNVVSYLS